jgi:hypothetical protein
MYGVLTGSTGQGEEAKVFDQLLEIHLSDDILEISPTRLVKVVNITTVDQADMVQDIILDALTTM